MRSASADLGAAAVFLRIEKARRLSVLARTIVVPEEKAIVWIGAMVF